MGVTVTGDWFPSNILVSSDQSTSAATSQPHPPGDSVGVSLADTSYYDRSSKCWLSPQLFVIAIYLLMARQISPVAKSLRRRVNQYHACPIYSNRTLGY